MFLEGYDWEADDAVDKLRTMLWGLEALKMFDDRLSSSLSSIEKARKDLEDTINSVSLFLLTLRPEAYIEA